MAASEPFGAASTTRKIQPRENHREADPPWTEQQPKYHEPLQRSPVLWLQPFPRVERGIFRVGVGGGVRIPRRRNRHPRNGAMIAEPLD